MSRQVRSLTIPRKRRSYSDKSYAKLRKVFMSITFVYRDENNKVQVKKIEYEEVKKDLMKYLSHDIRSIIKEKEKDETASNI